MEASSCKVMNHRQAAKRLLGVGVLSSNSLSLSITLFYDLQKFFVNDEWHFYHVSDEWKTGGK